MKWGLIRTFWVTFFFNNLNITAQNDKRGFDHLKIAAGYSTSIFADKNVSLEFSNDLHPAPTFFCLDYIINDRFFVGLDYKRFAHTYSMEKPESGDVYMMTYHAFDLRFGVNRVSPNPSFTIGGFLQASARPSGTQNAFLDYISGSWDEAIFHNYSFQSFGFGAGFNLDYIIRNHLILSIELQYNYYFKKKHLRFRYAGWEEFDHDYSINRNMLTPVLKIGYQINFKENDKDQ